MREYCRMQPYLRAREDLSLHKMQWKEQFQVLAGIASPFPYFRRILASGDSFVAISCQIMIWRETGQPIYTVSLDVGGHT